jgi:NAD(P)H-hydrate epimerase
MAAKAALRVGAGLITIACSKKALPLYALRCMSFMTAIASKLREFEELLEDQRKNTVLLGPGNGINGATRDAIMASLKARKNTVLDADALTAFEGEPWELFREINSPVVMTPHEGEFRRLFPALDDSDVSKVMRASEAASMSNAVIVLKGNDTVIAHPDGRVAINTNAPAWLATAGSGDVLSGIIAGIMANGVDAFTASCMAVWLHGEAANMAGIGLIAEELPDYLPVVLRMLYNNYLKMLNN